MKPEPHTPNPLFVVGTKILASYPVLFLADPFVPQLLTKIMSKNLEKWKTKGLLTSYRFKVERSSRLTYRIQLHLWVSKNETQKMITDYINQLLAPINKNFD